MRGSVAARTAGSAAEASIIAPIFDRHTTVVVTLTVVCFLLLLVLLVPEDANQCRSACALIESVHDAAIEVALIERFALGSARPWTISVSYFSALIAAVPIAIMVALTRLRRLNWNAFADSGPRLLLGRLFGYVLWAAQFLFAPGTSGLTRGNLITVAIQQSRLALALWVALIFAASALVLVAMLIELLARTSKGRKPT